MHVPSNPVGNPLYLNASHYVEHSSLQNGLAKDILSTYPLRKNAHIVDIGCGDGRITAELAKCASEGKVIGLDPSQSMISSARERFPEDSFANLSFQLGVAEDASFERNSLDNVVSFSCFHWLKDAKKAISQLSASLKPQGEMLILTYPKESPYYQYLEQALVNYPDYQSSSSNKTMLSISDYRSLLPKCGLDIYDFEEKHLTALYNNVDELKEFIRGWLDSYVLLPRNLHDVFLQEVADAVLKDPSTSKDGKISVPYTAIIIKARKVNEDKNVEA